EAIVVGEPCGGIGKAHRDMMNGGRNRSIAQRMARVIGRAGVVGSAWLMLAMGGCLAPQTTGEPAHTYRLGLDHGHDVRRPSTDAPVLLVGMPQAEPGYDTTKMAYLKRPYEVEYYAVNQWAEQPSRMFGSLLIQTLGATGVWRAVVPWPSSIHGDFRLDSYGFAIQQEFLQNPSLVRVRVRAQLVDLKESRIVGIRAFERVEQAPTQDAYGGVVAANRATAALLEEISSWLSVCLKRPQECGR
ncbi:MAG: ABC-type transport auxiliary lipoprotein family protein, partial [Nitrospira sp.]|nr:ABC-type transport auxiliary lipoprotein family protein [Nitrospira sp.]